MTTRTNGYHLDTVQHPSAIFHDKYLIYWPAIDPRPPVFEEQNALGSK